MTTLSAADATHVTAYDIFADVADLRKLSSVVPHFPPDTSASFFACLACLADLAAEMDLDELTDEQFGLVFSPLT
jgi:hypothetical protein